MPNDKELKTFTVTAQVDFTVTATSITSAYKEFTRWMAKAFNDSFTETDELIAVPSYYEGVAISKNPTALQHRAK